ncbi:chromatin assembly factor 1 subunit a, partial [Plakobranchus ocellatus]
AKLEEKRKKEEEKKQKEEEKLKEEEEKKKKEEKTKQAFQSFFIKSKENVAKLVAAKSSQGPFVPFQIKKDMHLAPATRRDALSDYTKLRVDQALENPDICMVTYIRELKSGVAKPHKTGRILRVSFSNPKPSEDIEVIHDPEALKKVLHRVKLLQFHTDYRPPYYGTWRKKPKLSPRNPWKKDESLFDYEVDSDDEWEEEEPGESLSCSDYLTLQMGRPDVWLGLGLVHTPAHPFSSTTQLRSKTKLDTPYTSRSHQRNAKQTLLHYRRVHYPLENTLSVRGEGEEDKAEKGEEDEDDEDGWMVPHGYLSEDEGCNEDDEITPEKLKLQQLAKAKAWEEEQKRKLQAAPLIAVGCFFEYSPSPLMAGDVRLLYEFRGVIISPDVPIPTSLFGCPEAEAEDPITPEKTATTPSQRGSVKKAVPDEAMPDLIRLVHGNTGGIKRLIKEFRVFWLKKEIANNSVEPITPEGKLDKSLQGNDDDVSMLDDSGLENPNESDGKQGDEVAEDKKKDDGLNCSISKRQLDIKINAIAVREKRQGFKICWYVHDSVLKEFDLEGLVCNSLVQPEPLSTVEGGKDTTPTPVKDQRSIMDFALSKEECAKKEIIAPKDAENSKFKPHQKDQKSITDFALPSEILTKQEAADSLPTSQGTPKNTKKHGQLSIMDFAKSDQGKSNLSRNFCKSEIPMETEDQDVIIIDSTSDIEMSSTAGPGQAKPADCAISNSDTPSKGRVLAHEDRLRQLAKPLGCIPSSSNADLENPKPVLSEAKKESKISDTCHKVCFVKLENIDSFVPSIKH